MQRGAIESQIGLVSAQAQFEGTLATFTVTNTNDAGAGSFSKRSSMPNSLRYRYYAFSAGAGLATILPTTALPDSPTRDDRRNNPAGFVGATVIQLSGTSLAAMPRVCF